MKMDRPESCPVHSMDTDEDCDACTKEVDDLGKYGEYMVGQLNLLQNEIGHMGAQIDPMMVLNTRIDTFIGAVLHDPRQRQRFECLFLEQVKEMLETARTEVSKQKLKAGVGNITPIDLSKMRRK